MSYTLIQGDCLDVLKTMPDASVSAVVTDPPYGLSDHTAGDVVDALKCWLDGKPYTHGKGGFMNRAWDHWPPGPEVWREVYRVLKPGGHLLAFAGSRTHDLMGIAIRLAGFELRDTINHAHTPHYLGWVQGQGFPKSIDISKQIDLDAFTDWLKAHRPQARRWTRKLWKATDKDRWAWRWCELAAARWGELTGKRGVVGRQKATGNARGKGAAGHYANGIPSMTGEGYEVVKDGWDITAPATDAAKAWDGYGSQLKPALEPILLFQKPLAEPTIAAQVLANGCGAINIDSTRVAGPMDGTWGARQLSSIGYHGTEITEYRTQPHAAGRFPANLILSHLPTCQRVGSKRVKGDKGSTRGTYANSNLAQQGHEYVLKETGQLIGYADADGLETVDAYVCADGCPIAALDAMAGVRKSGGRTKHAGDSDNGQWRAWEGRTGPPPTRTTDFHRDSDTGNASRFFPVFSYEADDFVPWLYASKASRSERDSGLEAMPETAIKDNTTSGNGQGEYRTMGRQSSIEKKPLATGRNTHPTCKPVALGRWLSRLICPPGGVILDPFAGSGSLGVSAILEGFDWIGIDAEAEYIPIARARCEWAISQRPTAEQLRMAV